MDGLIRWTIEAKAPSSAITTDDVEQAYSYARHPEVRAVLFAVINGVELHIYQTDHAPEATPILALRYMELPTALQQLENLLGPDALRRQYPRAVVDVGRPIGPGLRSVVRIVSGFVEFQRSEPPVPLLSQVTLFISDGSVERNENGTLVLYVQMLSPFRGVNRLNERMGLRQLELTSPDSELSARADSQTTFRQQMVITFPAGETIPNLAAEGDLVLQRNLICHSSTGASGNLVGDRFVGQFLQRYDYRGLRDEGDQVVIEAVGRFEAVLA